MLRRLSVGMVLAGIGFCIAVTPSVWQVIVYLIPAFTVCLLIAGMIMFIKTQGKR